MQKRFVILASAILVAGISMAFILTKTTGEKSTTDTPSSSAQVVLTSTSGAEDFKWYSVKEALELQKTTQKKLFIDVYTTWCGPCKMLEANTFSNETIRGLLKDYYIPTKFNAESGDTIIFQGQTFVNANYSPQPRKSTHQFAVYIASTQQGLGYPTMVFLDENQQMIQPISGYLTPQQLEPILTYFGSDAYKTTQWPEYFSSFKSSISQ